MKNCSFMFAMALCLCSLLTPYMSYGDGNDDFCSNMIKEDMAPISSIDYYNHAVCYRHGYGGVPINKKTAINLFIKSGELGNPEGFAVAARMYESGEGVLTDMNTAIKLFKKAVKGGNTAAMINLAYDYRNGENGLPKNLPEAVKLYQLAVQKGDYAAYCNLASMYAGGLGVKKNKARAADLVKKAVAYYESGGKDQSGNLNYCKNVWNNNGLGNYLP